MFIKKDNVYEHYHCSNLALNKTTTQKNFILAQLLEKIYIFLKNVDRLINLIVFI